MGEQVQILTDLSLGGGRSIVATDDDRHPPAPGDLYWAETTWWVFTNPADRLCGWVYLLTRPNMGVASLGMWLWDDSTRPEPWRLRYSKSFAHIPLPTGYSLRDLHLPDHRLSLVSSDVLSRYRIEYDDENALSLDLEFAAVLPPQPMGAGESTGHFDQPMWATGTVRIGGSEHAIDAPAFRDRTWSTRPETASERANCYSWGTARDVSFQLLAMLDDAGDPVISGGFLHRDGETAPLTVVRRHVVERHAATDAPARIEIDLRDALGRDAHVTGRCITTAALPGFAGYLTFASMVDWDVDGVQVWGEDHDSWPHTTFVRRFG